MVPELGAGRRVVAAGVNGVVSAALAVIDQHIEGGVAAVEDVVQLEAGVGGVVAWLDVPAVELEGTHAADGGDRLNTTTTKVIARVEGIHTVRSGSDVTLRVKTHLAHFFDPATGNPLR